MEKPDQLRHLLSLFDEPQAKPSSPATPNPAASEISDNATPKSEVFRKTIYDLTLELESRLEKTTEDRSGEEKGLKQREEEITALFEESRKLLRQEKIEDALKLFIILADRTQNTLLVTDQIEKIRLIQKNIEELQADTARLKSSSPGAPEALASTLGELKQKLEKECQAVNENIAGVEKELREKSYAVEALLVRGKTLWMEGQESQALAAFEELAKLVERPAPVLAQIQEIRRLENELGRFKNEWSTLHSQPAAQPSTPSELWDVLTSAQKKISEEGREIESRILRAGEDALERKETLQRLFSKAKSLVDQNQIGQAVAEWDKAAALLGTDTEFKTRLESLKKSLQELAKVSEGLEAENRRLRQAESAPATDSALVQSLARSTAAEAAKKHKHSLPPAWIFFLAGAAFFAVSIVWIARSTAQNKSHSDQSATIALNELTISKLKSEKSQLAGQISDLKNQNRGQQSQTDTSLRAAQNENKKLTAQLNTLKDANLEMSRQLASLTENQKKAETFEITAAPEKT